jgi:hypothetical protein
MCTHSPRRDSPIVDADAKPDLYEIRIRGVLSDTLLAAFPDLEPQTQGTETVLVGALPDQAALFGVLAQIEALGLNLLGLRYGPSRPEDLDADGEPAPGPPARTRRGRKSDVDHVSHQKYSE